MILTLRYAADALRALHRNGLLTVLLPEFQAIDALVIRDYYHRYTVDEHSFLTIENLHRLRQAEDPWEKRFAEILGETERPELLFLALLVHDIGKGMPGEQPHRRQSQALDHDPGAPRAGCRGGRHRPLPGRQSSGDVDDAVAPRHLRSRDGSRARPPKSALPSG